MKLLGLNLIEIYKIKAEYFSSSKRLYLLMRYCIIKNYKNCRYQVNFFSL